MTAWVALLRGVNVGGIAIRNAELTQLFVDLHFDRVRTVLASGNVVFFNPAAESPTEMKARIEAGLRERFGYDAWIVLIPHAALAGIIDAYPFAQDGEHHAYVLFASTDEAHQELLAGGPTNNSDGPEQVAAGQGVVYWRCPRGASLSTPFARHVAKSRFKMTTTNRNINTLRKLL